MSETYLLTGASSDIGRAVIRRLPEGSTVLCHHHSGAAALTALADELPRHRLLPIRCDLADRAAVVRWVEELGAAETVPTRIVHLAAPPLKLARFRDLDWTELERSLQVQVHAIGLLLQRLLPRVAKERGGGKVVFVLSSVVLGSPPAHMTDYVVAKHALLGLMRAVAAEWSPKNIDVNAVSPTMTSTRFLDNVPEKAVEMAAARHPRKRNASPDEVAAAIAYLLSDDSSFVSGANLAITGGEAS